MPVKTIRRSRGSSTSTFLRLCSRAPRTRIVSAIPLHRTRHLPPIERMFGRRSRSYRRPELAFELGDLVAQPGRFLEAQVLGRLVHLFFEGLDQPSEVVGRHAGE